MLIIAFAIVGAGLVTGLLFAFSNFVMRALAELSNEQGMFAMQQVNEKIINPLFMLFFLGTPALCVFIAIRAAIDFSSPGNLMLVLGSLCYLAGPFGITILCNVPLNNQLAKTEAADANTVWPEYQVRWQRWNHLRTFIGALSILLLAVGLGQVGV